MAILTEKLFEAIANKFIGGSADTNLAAAFAGRYFPEVAEGSPTFPYVVCEIVPNVPITDAYGNATSEDATVIFKVIGNGRSATSVNMATLKTALDNTTLTLSGATNIGMYRVGGEVAMRLGSDQAGADVWQWSASYTYQLQ